MTGRNNRDACHGVKRAGITVGLRNRMLTEAGTLMMPALKSNVLKLRLVSTPSDGMVVMTSARESMLCWQRPEPGHGGDAFTALFSKRVFKAVRAISDASSGLGTS